MIFNKFKLINIKNIQVEDFKKNHPTNIQESDDDTFIKTINSETQNI